MSTSLVDLSTWIAVKHAGDAALNELADVLELLRTMPALREKKRGTFYRGGRAFLHFHEDPAGLFADVRLADDFERLPVVTARDRAELVRRIRGVLE